MRVAVTRAIPIGLYVVVLLAGAATILPALGAYGLWDPWEPRYAQSVVEMVERGSWTVPYYLDTVRLTKPILVYWGILAGTGAVGMNEWGIRLPGALFALVGLAVVVHGTRRMAGTRAALLAGTILASSPQYYFLARQATPDIWLAVSLGTFLLWFANRIHLGWAYAAFGLAVLAKGPVIAPAVLVGTVAIHTLWTVGISGVPTLLRDRASWREAARFAGIAALVAGPWYAVATWLEPGEILGDLILFNHVDRATGVINRETGNSDFYVRTLLYGVFPWAGWVPTLFALHWARGRRGESDRAETWLTLSIVVAFTVFTASTTKFSHYIAPVLLPLAAMLGTTIDRVLDEPRAWVRRLAWGSAFAVYVPTALDLFRPTGARHLFATFTITTAAPPALATTFTVLLAALGAIYAAALLARARSAAFPLAIGVAALVLGNFCTARVVPDISVHKSLKRPCERFHATGLSTEHLGYHGAPKHTAFFYCDNALNGLEAEEIPDFLAPGTRNHAIIETKRLSSLAREYRRRFPDREWITLEDSHFQYTLVAAPP